MNADEIAYIVAPQIMSWDSGKGLSILKPGDPASVTANGKTVSGIVGDFGPKRALRTNAVFGEISYRAVQELGILVKDITKVGPVVVGDKILMGPKDPVIMRWW